MGCSKRQLGRLGESIAYEYLLFMGYTILARNWRFRRFELDCVAKDGDCLVLVEVKSRSQPIPCEHPLVSHAQISRLLTAGSVFAEHIGHEWEFRLDTILVIWDEDHIPLLNHTPNAFFPGW